jgi:hypothetical protein
MLVSKTKIAGTFSTEHQNLVFTNYNISPPCLSNVIAKNIRPAVILVARKAAQPLWAGHKCLTCFSLSSGCGPGLGA